MPQASGAEATDQSREASAYNLTIYLMAGMPFLLLAGFGFGVYRSLNRKAVADALAAPQQPADEGDHSCSIPSRADVS